MNTKQINAHWEEILRLAASIQQGTVTASLMLGVATAACEIGSCDHSGTPFHRPRPFLNVQFFTNRQVTPITAIRRKRE